MGELGGFLKVHRVEPKKRRVEERKRDFEEYVTVLPDSELREREEREAIRQRELAGVDARGEMEIDTAEYGAEDTIPPNPSRSQPVRPGQHQDADRAAQRSEEAAAREGADEDKQAAAASGGEDRVLPTHG